MQTITIHINKRVSSVMPDTYIVADNNEWKIFFDCDNEWNKFFLKTARIYIGEEYADYPLSTFDNTITLPPLPQDSEKISVGIYATFDTVTYSSTTVEIPVKPSALADGGGSFVPVEPAVMPMAESVALNDTLVINDVSAGEKVLATVNQIISLVQASGVTMEQLRQALSYYRMASEQDVIDLNLSDAISHKYTKPGSGIPKNDLASSVQASLDKADTALQSAPVSSVNGQTGVVELSIPSSASDVGAATPPTYTTLTLAVADWESSGNAYSCSKTVTGMTATSIVWLSYSDTETEFAEAQSTDTLTFTVSTLPSDAITVNVAFMEGSAL